MRMSDILTKASITQLIVLDLSLGQEQLRTLTHLCDGAAVRMLALHDLDSYFNHTTMTFKDDGVRFIGMRDSRWKARSTGLSSGRWTWRWQCQECCWSCPSRPRVRGWRNACSPPGPVFFAQTRVGMLGRPFQCSSHRTMHVNQDDEARQASPGDERIFRRDGG